MNAADPSSLNDDYVRTWTISSAADEKERGVFEICVKLVNNGHVSPLLFKQFNKLQGLKLLGVGGEFSCFHSSHAGHVGSMIWIAAGSGVTPFLSMCKALRNSQQPHPDITLLLTLREADLEVADPLMNVPFLRTKLFVSDKNRRMNDGDIAGLPHAQSIWICGPSGFMEAARMAAEKFHPNVPLVTESFKF